MIIYTTENLFNSPAQTLVNPVNTVGVMGKGIAKDFKKYYPAMFKKYKYFCENRQFNVGELMLSKEEPIIYRKKVTNEFRKRWILNFPTKKHWRNKSQLEYIELGLKKFVSIYAQKDIQSVSFPQLGIGNGGLNWYDVKILMEKYLQEIDIPVYIHLYGSLTEKVESKKILENLNTSHDAWKENTFLKDLNILQSKKINCDGIVLGDKNIQRDLFEKLDNIKKINIKENEEVRDLMWLQKNTVERKLETQLDLFESN